MDTFRLSDRQVNLIICSRWPHCSQIVAGFLMLEKAGAITLSINNSMDTYPGRMAIVEADYNGKRIIYDLDDGYQNKTEIEQMLKSSDYYFKRSFSSAINKSLFSEYQKKMEMLGLNYHVTFPSNPYDNTEKNIEKAKKRIKEIFGIKMSSFYNPELFEAVPSYKADLIKIIFYTRLWEPNSKHNELNYARIDLIRALRKEYGSSFWGGIEDGKLARELADDLIVTRKETERYHYLNKMKQADICIATTGLNGSIGWKTAEYVAAGKAIVTERLQYDLPGSFADEKNYLVFSSTEECLEKIDALRNNPSKLYDMKMQNHIYYQYMLRPDMLVKRTLDIVDAMR